MSGTPVLIAGPTASGKSALALALARELGGAIINCDSMQIYQGLHVLTARPSAEEEREAPHLLYGVMPPSERCSAGRYFNLAKGALAECEANGWRPIFVGGTGLYFRALTEGLSNIPPIPPEIRARAEAVIKAQGIGSLYQDLAARDPETAAQIRSSDPQRIQRAWEVWRATGRSLASWQREPQVPLLTGPSHRLVLEPPRDWLYARCDARFLAMLEHGATEEVEKLQALQLDLSLPAMKALGVREIAAWQAGEISREAAVAQAQMLTRRYAKRQLTWMRNQMPDWTRIDPAAPGAVEAALAAVVG